jgi:hypothetical protein
MLQKIDEQRTHLKSNRLTALFRLFSSEQSSLYFYFLTPGKRGEGQGGLNWEPGFNGLHSQRYTGVASEMDE